MISITIVLLGVRTRRMGQRYNVPVLRYRTPFEYAGQTPYMNDKCSGCLDPGIALDSTRVYLSLWRDPRYSSLYFPGSTFPVCPGLPNEPLLRQRTRCKVGSIVCSLTQSIHFLSYLVFSNQIFQYPLLISTPNHLHTIKLLVHE